MPPALPLLVLAAVQFASLLLGYNGHRVFQLAVLMLPAWLWLWFPLASAKGRALQLGLAGLTALLVLADGMVRGFLWHLYQAEPQSTLVITALANTSLAETMEYLRSQQSAVMAWGLTMLTGLAVIVWTLKCWWQSPPPKPVMRRKGKVLLWLVVVLIVAGFATKSTRRHHP